jgi:hypothetical protein
MTCSLTVGKLPTPPPSHKPAPLLLRGMSAAPSNGFAGRVPLEYMPDRLKRGGFMDAWLTAAIKAYSRIKKAATELGPLGTHESDLCLLLQDRMKEQLKLKKEKARRKL